jgi:hypothetical protein
VLADTLVDDVQMTAPSSVARLALDLGDDATIDDLAMALQGATIIVEPPQPENARRFGAVDSTRLQSQSLMLVTLGGPGIAAIATVLRELIVVRKRKIRVVRPDDTIVELDGLFSVAEIERILGSADADGPNPQE